jgi:hypothetical protein
MNSSKFIWGLTVLSIGVILFMANLGYISQTVWFDILRLWPLIIIFIGLKLVVKNDYIVLVLGLITLVLSLGFVISNNDNKWQYRVPYMPTINNEDSYEANQKFTEKLDRVNIKKFDLSINTGATKLIIKDLPQDSEELYRIEAKNLLSLDLDKEIDDNIFQLDLSEQVRRMMTMPRLSTDRELTIYVSRNVELALDLNNGASKIDLDFSNLNLTDLEVRAGASNGELTFSEKEGIKNISLAAGATDFSIYLPKSVGLKVENSSGLSNVNIDSDFNMLEKIDDVRKSQSYDSAISKYNIDIKSGASNVKILTK